MAINRLLAFRYLRHRWDRALLIIASIALGVATLVSSQTLTRVIETAAEQSMSPMRGAADIAIDNGAFGVKATLAEEIRAANLPNIKSVQPLLFERISLPALENRPVVLLGADLSNAANVDASSLGIKVVILNPLDAIGLPGGSAVIVSKHLYDALAAKSVTIRLGNRTKDCRIAGYFEAPPDSAMAGLGRSVILLELNAASKFVYPGESKLVKRIDITLTGGDREAARQAVDKIVAGRGAVNVSENQGRGAQEIITGMKTSFTLSSLGAMIVGLFLVYNAMSVTVAERRSDIGVMRAVGATQGQIVALFAALAAILGFIGSLIGIPLGLLLANVVLHQFREILEGIFLNPEATPTTPTPFIIGLALFAGVATAVLAALIPAIQAASDPPSDVVRRGNSRIGPIWKWIHRSMCVLLIGGGIGLILLRHQLPHRVGGFGGMMIALVGLLLTAPIFVSIFVALLNPLLRSVLPIEARLAADNLTRAPGRTGVVIGALAAGVAVMLQTAGVGKSNEVPITHWLDRMLRADLYVVSGNFAGSMSSQAPMDPQLVQDLRKLPGVEQSTALRFVRPEYNGTIIYIIAVDTEKFADQLLRRSDLPGLKKFHLAKGSQVLASNNFVARHKKNVGDMVTLQGANGPVNLEIVGAIDDYSWSRGTIIMDRAAMVDLFGDSQIDLAHVFLKEGEEDIGRAAVMNYLDKAGLFGLERSTMRDTIGGLVDRFYALAYLQQIVIGVVAALGVVTALLISVLQRKRELGLLLAVGATPAQVIRSVLWEALFMGLAGSLLGFLVGIPLEWYIVEVIFYEESGFVIETLIPWKQAFTIAAGAMTLAALAGLLPAWHAVRTRITEAIAYE